MDSMKSLNTSLPSARRKSDKLPNVHQSFRSAALTVTNLYKAALAEADNSRSEGYREALADLIHFLEKENIGGSDGEGARVRQWAADRLDGVPSTSDSEEEPPEERRARSSSPAVERVGSPEAMRTEPIIQEDTTLRPESAPPNDVPVLPMDSELPQQRVFNFRASHPYPSNAISEDVENAAPARRSDFTPRRPSHRSSNRNRQTAQALFNLGNGVGQKRKLPWNEIFNDAFNNDRRDGSGGGKRGRMA